MILIVHIDNISSCPTKNQTVTLMPIYFLIDAPNYTCKSATVLMHPDSARN